MAEIEESDRKMELNFGDNTSRSKAFLQLLAISGEGVANDDLVLRGFNDEALRGEWRGHRSS